MTEEQFELRPIGTVESPLHDLAAAPRQGDEGAPASTIRLRSEFLPAARNIVAGDELFVLTWLQLTVHPRDDESRPMTGVFSTRSPDRPNPIGLHRVKVLATGVDAITVEGLEAVDGTPVLDLKPVLGGLSER